MHNRTIATLCLLAAAISAARAQRPARPLAGGPADSLAVSGYLEAMQLDLAGFVLAEVRYFNETQHFTTSMDALNAKRALMGVSPTPGVALIVENVTDNGFRARATHRSAPGWTCGIIFGRAQPYRSGQRPGESRCWTKEEKNPRAVNIDSLITAEAGDDQVFMESVVDERPEVLSVPALTYPDLLRQAGVQGRVLVQAIIDPSGRAEPASLKVIQSPNQGFDQPAIDFVLRAMFRPARIHGRAVRVLVNLPIDFKIKR